MNTRNETQSNTMEDCKHSQLQKKTEGHLGLTQSETIERDRLLELQKNHSRWFSQQEFNRLRELDYKLFHNGGDPSESHQEQVLDKTEEKGNCEHCGGDGTFITNDSERVECPMCEKGRRLFTYDELNEKLPAKTAMMQLRDILVEQIDTQKVVFLDHNIKRGYYKGLRDVVNQINQHMLSIEEKCIKDAYEEGGKQIMGIEIYSQQYYDETYGGDK